jgi:hypothetical protein
MKSGLLFALGWAFIATAIITPNAAVAQAQDNAARDAAIARCIKQAHTQYPDEQEGNDRTAVYKACMTQAGFQP